MKYIIIKVIADFLKYIPLLYKLLYCNKQATKIMDMCKKVNKASVK